MRSIKILIVVSLSCLTIFSMKSLAFSQAELNVNPTFIDFGPTNVGTTATQPLTVSNSGNELLEVTDIFFTYNELNQFSVTHAPLSLFLKQGESAVVDAHFNPDPIVSFTMATLQIKSTAGEATVSMLGLAEQTNFEISLQLSHVFLLYYPFHCDGLLYGP